MKMNLIWLLILIFGCTEHSINNKIDTVSDRFNVLENSVYNPVIPNSKITLLEERIIALENLLCKPVFYVSNSGSDLNDGLTEAKPFRTVHRICDTTLHSGSIVKFKKGDIWHEKFIIESGGTVAAPIVFSSYGTGDKPTFTGFTEIKGWTNETGGIYSKTIAVESNPNFIIIDGVQYAMGRFPDAGTYLIVDSHSANISISDATLNSSVTDWDNAELVLRKNEYVIVRCLITNHTNSTLTYTDAYRSDNATDGYYYFIQNDLRTLTKFGEWFYNGSKLYVYFGTNDPADYTVKIPVLDHLFYNNLWQGSYIKMDGLKFTGCNSHVIYQDQWYTPYNTVENCEISDAGGAAIHTEAEINVINNYIHDVNFTAVYTVRTSNIIDNEISNVGIIEGIPLDGTNTSGIRTEGLAPNTLIQYNRINNIGYDGIIPVGNGTLVMDNTISNYCINLNDGGGIYMSGSTYKGMLFERNKIFNGIGKKGISSRELEVTGIYFDDLSDQITARNNVIYSCNGAGIYLHSATNIILYNNTVYNTKYGCLINNTTGNSINYNYDIRNNIFYSLSGQYPLRFASPVADDVANLGIVNYNLYFNLVNNTNLFSIWDSGFNSSMTFAAWKTYSSQDANSVSSNPLIISTTNLHLHTGSPAINAGTNIGLLNDYEGRPINGKKDIGAYEKQ